MKYIISRYNHDLSWLKNYTDDYVLYDRSEQPLEGAIVVPNIGSDIYDKFTYIIDNYDNLPDVAVYTKANLFKYITPEEFDKVKDNQTYTPLFTKLHKVDSKTAFYSNDGMYNERNSAWIFLAHPLKSKTSFEKLLHLLKFDEGDYWTFAPGSNYILPKENILQHSKEFYKELRGFLEWAVYPGEALFIERQLHKLWNF